MDCKRIEDLEKECDAIGELLVFCSFLFLLVCLWGSELDWNLLEGAVESDAYYCVEPFPLFVPFS